MFALKSVETKASLKSKTWACVASGLLAALAYTYSWLHGLAWVALVPALAAFFSDVHGFKRGAWLGFAVGLPLCLGSLSFFTALHPLTWRGMDMVTSLLVAYVLAWGGLSFMLTVGYVLFGAALGVLAPHGVWRLVVTPLLWIVFEWSQRLGMMALPWLPLSLTQVSHPEILQLARFGGSPLVSALIVLANAAIASWIADWKSRRYGQKLWQLPGFRHVLATAVIVLGSLGYGLWQIRQPLPSARVSTAVIQGNIRPDVKWKPGSLDTILDEHERLSRLAAPFKPDLVVWAESAVPLMFDESPQVVRRTQDLAKEIKSHLLIGTFDRAANGYYNGATLMTPEGRMTGWYYKRHLVPFGEFLPYRDVLSKLGPLAQINALGVDVIPGRDAALLKHPKGKIGTLICFESIFPHEVRQSVLAGADWLTIITNDAWYKHTQALDQHNGQAVLRAVETQRSVVRAANTGISSLIDPYGRIKEISGRQIDTVLTGELPIGGPITPYVRFGDWPVAMAGVVLFIAWVFGRRVPHVAPH